MTTKRKVEPGAESDDEADNKPEDGDEPDGGEAGAEGTPKKKRDNGLLRQTRYDLENLERQIDL